MRVRDFLKNCFQLTDEDILRQLTEISKIEYFEKGKMLVEAGEVQTLLPVLAEGVFRGFLIDPDGRDITDCFAYQRGDVVMGCSALGMPSQISIEALTSARCLMIPVQMIISMTERYPEFMQLENQYLMDALERHWEGKMLMHRCTAMQRYQWFLHKYPGMIDSVSNKHIASFLGMTPVTLSRLRRQLRERMPSGMDE